MSVCNPRFLTAIVLSGSAIHWYDLVIIVFCDEAVSDDLDELVQSQVRHFLPKVIVLLLKALELFQLVGSHAAVPLAPAVLVIESH